MNQERLDYPKTFILGLGFMGVSMIWALYNAYVPIFLRETFGLSFTLVGGIMTLDNILAIILLPLLGVLSDRARTPLGRRRPFILAGAPLAFLFFALIPLARNTGSLGLMMLAIILMNLSMALFRSPVIALMPDLTPSRFRSQANGIINFMGGVGALLVYFGGKTLYDIAPGIPFVAGGTGMFLACMAVVVLVREPALPAEEATGASGAKLVQESFRELGTNLRELVKGEKSLLLILVAIYLWFVGFNAIETFFTSYAKFYLGLSESTGALILGIYSAFFILGSIPAGYVAKALGRNLTIRLGLVALTVLLLASLLFKDFWPVAILFGVAGLGWSMINVNSLPMVVDMSPLARVGGYTGLYYFFSQAANISAPPLGGLVLDIATAGDTRPQGYLGLIIFAAVFFILALGIMFMVKRGEARTDG